MLYNTFMKRTGIFLSATIFVAFFSATAFCGSMAAEFLCETGINFYQGGYYNDARHEFKKALMVDPDNQVARSYMQKIDRELAAAESHPQPPEEPKRQQVMEEAITRRGPAKGSSIPLKISGEAHLGVGVTSEDGIWKRGNYDLNEKNFRVLSNEALNLRENTYDPAIFNRLRVNLDTQYPQGLNVHTNLTVDPWSFTGTSDKITVFGKFGYSADVQLKYWSNTGYTTNQIITNTDNGDSFVIPELKVVNGRTEPVTVQTVFGNTFTIPSLKIHPEFNPVRELWFDYSQKDTGTLRFFPIAYENQALTSDDPLRLSNNHIWWEPSPWIYRWAPGHFNPFAQPPDFTQGQWDSSLAFLSRDSDGLRLTALRGLSFSTPPGEALSLTGTFATPKDLWQDYGNFDNIINATRLKYSFADNLQAGSLYAFRAGFDENEKRDSYNHVFSADAGYEFVEGAKVSAEVSASRSQNDLTSPDFKTGSRGNAYYLSLTGTFPAKNIMAFKYGYPEIKPLPSDSFFAKYQMFYAHMDEGFDPALSTYRQTRRDAAWSRHIHFRQAFEYTFTGLYYPAIQWDDIEPFRIGNGIDIGRDVFGFRLENSLWERRLENLFDIRNVHDTHGELIENVTRDEFTFKITDKLTSKLLAIHQAMPLTKAGIDPFIFNTDTGEFLLNDAIEAGLDPSIATGSLGLEYAFTDRIALSGIWEYTNDYSVGYENYPRGNLNGSSFKPVLINGKVFHVIDPFLYRQGLFPLPPYEYYNIFRAGLRVNPAQHLEVYFDYTRNSFESAGQVDDNDNHVGMQVSYVPTQRVGFYLRYTYSRFNDIGRMLAGQDKIYLGHHNVAGEIRYLPTQDDEFSLLYGVAGRAPIATATYDPYGGFLSTVDTQHILRLYYRRRF